MAEFDGDSFNVEPCGRGAEYGGVSHGEKSTKDTKCYVRLGGCVVYAGSREVDTRARGVGEAVVGINIG